MIIRKLEIDDLHDILEIENICFSVPWSEDAFKAELNNDKTYYNCVEICGKVVGYAGLWKIIDEGHITNIAISPEYREKGYGKELVKDILKFCENNNINSITLEVRESNEAAINLYEKFGFEAVGIRPSYYTKPIENALIMWKK